MGKYVVTNGQNIYDVALHIYGSIEGIVDLLMNNAELSLSDDLRTGDELIYTDDFIINADIVAYNSLHGIIPSNGERRVYPKYFTLPLAVTFRLLPALTSVGFTASGSGKIEIDWGDNSPVETVVLSRSTSTYTHVFDNEVADERMIRWYTNASFVLTDWSGLQASSIRLLRPLRVEELALTDRAVPIDFLYLTEGMYEADLHGLVASDLSPLISCLELMRLDLADARLKSSVVDSYLMQLVAMYGLRRNCEVILSVRPGGEYREPERDENGRYRVRSGMEAIWVIVHEPAWNEGGPWKFVIGNEVYTVEQ